MMKRIIGVFLLLGTLALIAGVLQRVFYLPQVIGLVPTAYLKFAEICLLLAIGLCARELAFKGK